ncbi:MAG: hypothetical protein E6Q40_00920 [Cupriavidus sp.]|nr:MAG: hypothetical protein E6Q40_00920 [Cupriavidus sp.]
MTIEIQSMTAVSIDGTQGGCVVDVFANFPDHRAPLQDALMAFEQSLRDEIATLKTSLKAAQDAAADAEAKAAEDVAKAQQEAQAAIQTAQNEAKVAIERAGQAILTAQQEAEKAINEGRNAADAVIAKVTGEANQQIAAAQEESQKAKSDCAFAQKLQQLHWQQAQLMMGTDAEAAVAVLKEIKRMELVAQTAALEAQKSQLGA